jgi:uncharacterized protein (UPF0335 family)
MSEGTMAADQLRLFIERIERLEEEKKNIADDIKDVYAEAKANGYHTKTMRKCIALRKMETHQRHEEEALLETYKNALGMDGFDTTPLAMAAEAVSEFQKTCEEGGITKATMKVADGPEVVLFDKDKPKKSAKKVRDPSDGGLVTVPEKAAANG